MKVIGVLTEDEEKMQLTVDLDLACKSTRKAILLLGLGFRILFTKSDQFKFYFMPKRGWLPMKHLPSEPMPQFKRGFNIELPQRQTLKHTTLTRSVSFLRNGNERQRIMGFRILAMMLLFAGSVCTAQPYEPHVIWDRSGLQDSSSYGTQILPLGDQDDDGFADWAVMAWGNKGYGGTQAAFLEFFHGGTTMPTNPYLTYRVDSTVYSPSWSVIEAGDVNGDGYQDWLLWAWPVTHPSNYLVPIFYGGPEADTIPDAFLPTTYQSAIYSMGDFNGDGFSDFFTYNEFTHIGSMYYGGSLMDTTADWVLHGYPAGLIGLWPYATGDFNGDDASDFLCFNSNNDTVTVFLGGADPDTVPAYVWGGFTSWPIGGVRSLNGDPYDEFLFESANAVEVYFGDSILQSVPGTTIQFSCTYTLHAVGAGDFNHDGFNDLLTWDDQCDGNMFGALTLHLGHPWLNPVPVFTIEGSWPDGLINIYTAVGIGDVNGDHLDDFAIGAWDDFAYLGWRGRCVIVAGDTLPVSVDDPRPEIPKEFEVTAYPNPFNSLTTIRVQIAQSYTPVLLSIFNVLGQSVKREMLPRFSREYEYHFNAQDLSTGLYIVQVESGELHKTQKLMLLR